MRLLIGLDCHYGIVSFFVFRPKVIDVVGRNERDVVLSREFFQRVHFFHVIGNFRVMSNFNKEIFLTKYFLIPSREFSRFFKIFRGNG